MADDDNILHLPDLKRAPRQPGSDGSGPEGPMLADRVKNLEIKMDRVEARLSTIENALAEIKGYFSQMPKASDWANINRELGEIKGKISQMPTTWQLIGIILAAWSVGLSLVFALVRYGLK